MKPLLYLTYRQFVNAIHRALSNPRRVIGLLFFLGNYAFIFIRPFLWGSRGTSSMPVAGVIDFPPAPYVEAIVFTLLSAVSLFLMGPASIQQNAFKPADVDILFPTPISAKLVLVFRIVRDTFLSLLIPLALVLFGFYPAAKGWESLFRNLPDPGYASYAIRALMVSYFLISLCWVVLGYAMSLHINRSDMKSSRNKWMISATMGTLSVGIIAYVVFRLRDSHGVAELVTLTFDPVLRVFFFPATLATKMVMAPLSKEWLYGIGGFVGLLGVIFIGFKSALSQSNWMYDQAAVRGYGSSTQVATARKTGDVMALMAERARQGKVKVRTDTWIHRMQLRGAWALLWKEYFMQVRGTFSLIILMGLISLFISILPVMVGDEDMAAIPLLYFMQGMGLLMTASVMGQVGFMETLRRIDLLKPLPIGLFKMATVEVIGRSIIPTAISWIGLIILTILKSDMWVHAVASMLLVPSFSVMLNASMLATTVLFPDLDDLTQKQFRGLVQMIAMAVTSFFPISVMATMVIGLKAHPILGAAVASALAAAIGLAACAIAGSLLRTFHPAE